MNYIKRIGIDAYMILLLATVIAGIVLPASGIAAEGLRGVTFWAVSLLFFLYGAKLDPSAVKAGITNWRLQGMTFGATYVLFPLIGVVLATLCSPILGATVTMGLLFLSVLPSTVQSSIAFTSIAGGNVPAAICAASVSNLIGVILTPVLVTLLLHQGDGFHDHFGIVEQVGAHLGPERLAFGIAHRGGVEGEEGCGCEGLRRDGGDQGRAKHRQYLCSLVSGC